MDLSQIRVKSKAKHKRRVGRGTGSGRGKTSGRGHKGAGQRSGKTMPYIGYRGGNLPYLRRIPKRGFTSLQKKKYQIVNLGEIAQRLENMPVIDAAALKQVNLIKNETKPVKILAKHKDKFALKAAFKVNSASDKARELIEAAGGKIEYVIKS